MTPEEAERRAMKLVRATVARHPELWGLIDPARDQTVLVLLAEYDRARVEEEKRAG